MERPSEIQQHLVLDHTLKRLLFILVGGGIGVFLCYSITYFVGFAFGPLYKSEDDMTRNLLLYLIASVVFGILFGYAGNHVFKKHIQN